MNTATATRSSSHATHPSAPSQLDLDALAAMSGDQLESLFRRGTVPDDLAVLDGHPTGRMLAIRHMSAGMVLKGLSALARSRRFPWGGKSFQALDEEHGRGVNRVHLGGRHNLFPFETFVGSSAIDGEPTVVLDYELPDNPGFISAIHDEIREVATGLFMGPAMWKTDNGKALILWFALDTRRQAPRIGARQI